MYSPCFSSTLAAKSACVNAASAVTTAHSEPLPGLAAPAGEIEGLRAVEVAPRRPPQAPLDAAGTLAGEVRHGGRVVGIRRVKPLWGTCHVAAHCVCFNLELVSPQPPSPEDVFAREPAQPVERTLPLRRAARPALPRLVDDPCELNAESFAHDESGGKSRHPGEFGDGSARRHRGRRTAPTIFGSGSGKRYAVLPHVGIRPRNSASTTASGEGHRKGQQLIGRLYAGCRPVRRTPRNRRRASSWACAAGPARRPPPRSRRRVGRRRRLRGDAASRP